MSLDPTGAYQLLYDDARKSLNAVLENQGLRCGSLSDRLVTVRSRLVGGFARDAAQRVGDRDDVEGPVLQSRVSARATPDRRSWR